MRVDKEGRIWAPMRIESDGIIGDVAMEIGIGDLDKKSIDMMLFVNDIEAEGNIDAFVARHGPAADKMVEDARKDPEYYELLHSDIQWQERQKLAS